MVNQTKQALEASLKHLLLQKPYKSGGMINFLSFLFFCKLKKKKDKIGHTI